MAFAIILTFVEDFCRKTHRPEWLVGGIQFLSIVMFVADALVILRIAFRILCKELKGFLDRTDED
jgi:hypothetical protein